MFLGMNDLFDFYDFFSFVLLLLCVGTFVFSVGEWVTRTTSAITSTGSTTGTWKETFGFGWRYLRRKRMMMLAVVVVVLLNPLSNGSEQGMSR